jgi:hypothetical protein
MLPFLAITIIAKIGDRLSYACTTLRYMRTVYTCLSVHLTPVYRNATRPEPPVECGVEGVTALNRVGCNLRCQFGAVSCVTVGCTDLRSVAAFGTLGGETVICTLGGASLSMLSTGGGVAFDLCDGRAPSKIFANCSSMSILSWPT